MPKSNIREEFSQLLQRSAGYPDKKDNIRHTQALVPGFGNDRGILGEQDTGLPDYVGQRHILYLTPMQGVGEFF
jgi:hypothetical protein